MLKSRRAITIPALTLGLVSLTSLFGGCLYDTEERCGDNLVLKSGACVCPGETSLTEEGECAPFAQGIGESCTEDSDCPAAGAGTCVPGDDGSYCTVTGCSSAADCPPPYGCEVDAETPYCVQAPEGLDEPCDSDSDCSEYEATYCESLLEKKCKVECGDDPGGCHGDWVCCDFSALGGAPLCVSSSDLEDGACPFGADLVEAN